MRAAVSMYWLVHDSPTADATVDLHHEPDQFIIELLILCIQAAQYRLVNDQWEYCPDIFPLYGVFLPGTTTFDCDNPINLVDNIPDEFHEDYNISHSHRLEINKGIMTIYSDLDDDLKINISVEDFKLFHKNYSYVRMTHEPVTFSVDIW